MGDLLLASTCQPSPPRAETRAPGRGPWGPLHWFLPLGTPTGRSAAGPLRGTAGTTARDQRLRSRPRRCVGKRREGGLYKRNASLSHCKPVDATRDRTEPWRSNCARQAPLAAWLSHDGENDPPMRPSGDVISVQII